ncbi:MAG: HYR domain-containing protein [Bacteroidota bacterium]
MDNSTIYFKTYSSAYFDTYGSAALDADQSKLIFEQGGNIQDNGHSFWDVTFKTSNSGYAVNCNILGKLLFESDGQYVGNTNYVHNAEFRMWGVFNCNNTEVDSILFKGTGTIQGTNSVAHAVEFKGLGGINQYPNNGACYENGSNIQFGKVSFEENGWLFGDNTFDTLTFSPGRTYTLQPNHEQRITPLGDFISEGFGGFPIEIKTCQLGSQANLHKDGDPICLDFLYLTDIAATGSGFSYAGANSDDVYNNSGWIFEACPSCFTSSPLPAPVLSASSITTPHCGGPAILILANLPAGYEAVWFDANQSTELYASTNNLFQPAINQPAIYYGAFRELATGCLSQLLEVQVVPVDNPPVAVCRNITVTLGPGGDEVSINGADINNGSSDDCGIANLYVSPNTFSCPNRGPNTVVLTVTDNIGNTGTCTSTVTVQEYQNPITSLTCNDLVFISADQNCQHCIGSDEILEGGPYGCYEDYIVELDRLPPYGNGPWVPACIQPADIGKTVQVRVTDPITGNKCWGYAQIEDKINPSCLPPADIVVQCESFDPTLLTYEIPNLSDNCCMDVTKNYNGQSGLGHVVDYSLFDTVCNKGTLTRIFTVFDCGGNTSQCTQMVVVNYNQNYYVRFPDDTIVTNCNNSGIYGEPIFFGQDCELLGISFEDQVYPIVPDACFKIERVWTIINWCTYNPNLPCIEIPNPNPVSMANDPENFPGPTVSDCDAPAPWNPTIVKINPTDPTPTNYCTFWNANANCYRYTQIIKVIDTQAPEVVCPSNVAVDLGLNGTASVSISDLSFTYSDACYATNNLVVLPFNTQFFDCDDAGTTREVQIQVTDPCDNTGSCTIQLVVAPSLRCTPTALITDPCVCKNNATTLVNGQFDETIKIESLTGKIWTIVSNTGLYNANSPTPPVSPVLIPLGTTFAENPAESGNYYLNGIHVDAQGYSITASSESGETLTIGNQCSYPNPVITTDFSGTFCLFSDPVPLTGNPGDANIINQGFTINGIPATVFNPSQGVGTYVIEYTVNGGTPKASGPNDPGCISSVPVVVVVNPPPSIQCPSNVTVNADPGQCSAVVQNLSPITNMNECPSVLTHYVLDGGAFGSGNGDVSGFSFIVGQTTILYALNGSGQNTASCEFSVLVNDTQPPSITCATNSVLSNDPGVCTRLITNHLLDAVATDNCPGSITISHNYALASSNKTLFGVQFPVGITPIIWTVTDGAGNTSSCLQQVIIQDTQLPTFLNCPTQMLMVGNDVDQCAAKVNWPDPVAWDNCGVPTVIQFSGPLSGSNIPVSPLPDTIKYRATDASGNSAVCTFLVRVIDTQLPSINANVSIPANITVDCNAVPPPFVLTANDVHDNCTAPQNIAITFTQTLTQNNNPGTCGFYTFQIIRTWKITDAAGNMRAYTQVISVQDTQKPTAVCKNINLTLDDFGNASITPQQLDGGSSDNCTPAANLLFTASKTAFNCAQLGPNAVTFTVTDLCGNTGSCTAIVTVQEGNGKCIPKYDVNGSDPCVCLNNATTLSDGQFSELIQIQALAGQTWLVASNTGLFAPNSPNPPNAPLPIPNGTLLSNGLIDGLDNDHDGSTDETDERVYYTLRARHVDAQGYTAVLSAGAGLQLSLGNKCYYPTPYFSNLTDPFCLNTAPFNIAVNEINNAQGTVSIKVNGVVTNTFNAAALGVGFHTVTATFDAGSAQPFSTENGVTVNGSDASAQADPGCRQTISKVVQVVGTPSTVVCNDLVYVSLDADCMETLNADDVLEGTYLCYDDYTVELDKILPYGNGPWTPATVNALDIGKTYFYHVVHPISGNVCWGQIKIEDKLAPALTCPPNITIACSESTAAQHTGNVTVQDCSATSTVLDDTYTDFGLCSSPRSQIVRAFIVTDAWGNQASCSQTITITPFDLSTVVFPADITLNCETTYLNPAALTPINTGRPTINGASILGSVMCGAKVNYTDTYYQGCEGTYTILRVWSVLNDCLLVGPSNPITHTQRIKVDDFGGPVFDCPSAVMVSTDPTQCCATAALPDMIISEGCSHISDLEAKVTGTNPANGNIITFTVSGHLGDFPGNNYWTPDTLAIFPYTQCLPVGVYTVQYTAADQCGNTSKCAFQMTVADLVPPVAACDQWTQVDLGGNGMAFVDAATFDDGSHDNCAPVEFKVRRMQSNVCQSDTLFYDQVKFCCSDIDDTLLVVFRVYDVDVPSGPVTLVGAYEGHYNDCMVQVLVKDKIKPTCNPPANVTVDCENFDPSLWAYGTATAEDNCCIDTLTATANYALFDTVCNRGTITRTFRAYDCAGLTSQCTQRVTVNYLQDYYVKFPNDVMVTVCDGTGLFGEPTFFGKDCELLGISFEDQIFTVVPDACFEIERTWKIINWCTFNPNLPLTEVPNPNPNATSGSPQNLPGPIVSAPGTLAPWTATVVKVLTTDPVATNYSVFWAANTNGYVYKQIIKILDTQDPTAENCPDTLVTFCDVTPNDPLLWRDNFWWDDLTALHDLCEGPTDLTITATDACSGSNINIHYLLFLDLDNDGTMETVINSVNTGIAGLGWNAVPFNNYLSPNYGGGTLRAFDERAVPFNQKYGFAIQTTTSGTKKTASVRWNTQQSQNNFVVPELPYGTHKIKWFVEDGCGNESICEYTFIVKDCKKPTVVCLNGLSVNIMPTQMIQLWASDFLKYTEDNCTPANQLKIGIRKSGTGTGFPVDGNGNPITNVIFNCTELGTQTVELWSIDKAGNADFCETYVIVQDNNGNCPNVNAAKVAGALATEATNGLEEGAVQIAGSSNAVPSFNFTTMSDNTGNYNFNAIPLASNSTVTPAKDDNPLNGVSTYDLVLISKHILGIEPLNSPYKMIAADANKSGSITTFDIVELRKLILGIYSELPTNTSWRFVDKSFNFPNPANPFQTQFAESKAIQNLNADQLNEDFVSVKVGDVNGTAIANSLMSTDDRTAGTLLFDVNDQTVRAGETFTVSLTPAQANQGYQFTLNTNGLEVVDIAGLKGENYAVFAGATTFSVDGDQAQSVVTLTLKATKGGKVSELLSISSRITKAESYNNGQRWDVAFRFNKDGVQTISGVGFELYQNQPNPFVNKTVIGFHLPDSPASPAEASAKVGATLSIFDETGRTVFTQSGNFAKGYNSITIDRALLNTTGMLYYKLETATDSATKKMIQTK